MRRAAECPLSELSGHWWILTCGGWGLFGSRFSVVDAQATGTVLLYLCLGLGGWAAQTVISRGFYALGRTWLPTIVGTIIAFVMVPFYVVLRQIWGTIGLAVASSAVILVYVFLLGWLQYRRFEPRPQRGGRHSVMCQAC